MLLHAFPVDGRMWDGLRAVLADQRLIVLDAPGFGRSPAYEEVARLLGRSPEPSLETYADAVARSLRAVGVERAVVAGLSMGGYALMALAERHRSVLAGAGFLDTKAGLDDEEARLNRLRIAETAEREGNEVVAGMIGALVGESTLDRRPEVVRQVTGWLAESPAEGIAWAQRAMAARPERFTAIEDLEVPTLVLRGSEDELSPQSTAESIAAVAADHELVVVPRVGHLSAVEDPEAVASHLRALVARAEAAESGASRD